MALVVEHVYPGHVDADAAHFPLATFPQDIVFERFFEHFGEAQLSPRHMDPAFVLSVATPASVIEHMDLALTSLANYTTDVPETKFMAPALRIIDRTVPKDAEAEQLVGRTFPADVERCAEVEQIVGRTILTDVENNTEAEVEHIVSRIIPVEQCAEVKQIVGRTIPNEDEQSADVRQIVDCTVPRILEKIAEGTLDVPMQQVLGQATKELSVFENWSADVERVAAASGSSSDAVGHVAHARLRYEENKKQLATIMRCLPEGSASTSSRLSKKPRR